MFLVLKFQFLIGNLQTASWDEYHLKRSLFQFLIGNLQTPCESA